MKKHIIIALSLLAMIIANINQYVVVMANKNKVATEATKKVVDAGKKVVSKTVDKASKNLEKLSVSKDAAASLLK